MVYMKIKEKRKQQKENTAQVTVNDNVYKEKSRENPMTLYLLMV